MESRYEELPADERQRAARVQFALLLLSRTALLALVLVWLGSAYYHAASFIAHVLLQTLGQ